MWYHLDALSMGLPKDTLSGWGLCHGITLENPIRIFCVDAMLHKWFDRTILIAIFANALTLAADNPLDETNDNIFIIMETLFNVIFLIEFVIKVIALSGWGEKSGYFRDAWNRLDCTVLLCGWLPIFLAAFGVDGVNNFSFIRVIRILKILKTINTIPGLKRLVKAILNAIPRLISVANLLTIIFFLFGILGTQLFQGTLRRRCFPMPTDGQPYGPNDALCSGDGDLGAVQCPAATPICSEYTPGTDNPNSNSNIYSNFDNTPVSFLTIFVVISLEGWSSVMFDIVETSGYTACIYFIVLVVIGAYFVINLVIAVIYQSYIETLEELQSHEMSFRLLIKMEMEANMMIPQQMSPGVGAQVGLSSPQDPLVGEKNVFVISRQSSRETTTRDLRRQLSADGGKVGGTFIIRRQSSGDSTSRKMLRRQLTSDGGPPKKFQWTQNRQLTQQLSRQLSRQPSQGVLMQRQLTRQYTRQLTRQLTRQMSRQPSGVFTNILHINNKQKTVSKRLYRKGLIPVGVHRFLTVNPQYLKFKRTCQDIVSQQAFDFFVVIVILFNIVVLSIQANGSSEKNELFIQTSNVIVTIFFCLELIIQMVASDIIPYLSNGYNILDLVIVLASVIELFNSHGQLSVFQTFRVFRTFKLFKRWESLQELVRAIFVSGEGLGYFSIVLLLFLFVFSLTGRSLFAGKLPATSRTNFDSMFIAFVTTFQLVTGENWNDILYEVMEYNPTIGAIFCIIVYILGSLVVLNIFLAILLETFSNDEKNVDSYYDKLDSQTSLQSSLKAAWHRLRTAVGRVYAAFLTKIKEETEEEEEEGETHETAEHTAGAGGNVAFSSKATSQKGSFKRMSLSGKSRWIGK